MILTVLGLPLTRSADTNSSADITSGMYALVTEGSQWARTGWILTTRGTIQIDVTPLEFVQFTGVGSLVAGPGIEFSGNTLSAKLGNTDRIVSNALGLDLAETGITPGTFNGIEVDSYGRVVSATQNNYLTANQNITVSGDATGSGTTAITVTLANTGVSAGTWNGITVDTKGRITALGSQVFLTGNENITVNGDVTGSGTTNITTTLADTGVGAGSYGSNSTTLSAIIDSKGRIVTAVDTPIAFPVNSVAGRFGDVILTSADVGLSNVTNQVTNS